MLMSAIESMQFSTSLHSHAQKAVDYALKALNAADSLVPFAMTWRDGETTVERFMNGAYDDAIEMAMRAVNGADEGVSAYAVVWNGYIEVDGQRREAVVAEVADRAAPQSVQLAQPYRAPAAEPVVADGELLAVGAAQNLLLSKISTIDLSRHLLKPPYATTESLARDVTSQPFAQLPVALLCLAANLFEGEESERVTIGIRTLQSLEADTSVALSHRVFSVVTAAIADGNLMHVLPSDAIGDMVQIVLDGAAQVHGAVRKGLVWDAHASAYFDAVRRILMAVLTKGGEEPAPASGNRLIALLDKVTAG